MGLQRLEKSGTYRVAEGSADIRGWPLFDASGEKIGRVDGLLFDTDELRVCYVVADLSDALVMVPVAALELDTRERRVSTPDHDRAALLAMPPYRVEDYPVQEATRPLFDLFWARREATRPARELLREAPLTLPLLEERLRIDKRRERIGELKVVKTPVEELVERYVDVERDDVEITREPVGTPATGEERITIDGDVVRIPVIVEELVIEKRPVVKEIIELRRRPRTETVRVSETLRREEVTFESAEPLEGEGPARHGPVPRIDDPDLG